MKIDTNDVLAAANTKWNFLPFKPGLVGGHCIGVDPYYLTYKAEELGYKPEMIVAGRRINDSIAEHVANRVLKLMNRRHTVAAYRDVVERLRAARPDIALSSDFIVGFPGETDEDFEATMDLIEAIRFDASFSFVYSARPGTPDLPRPPRGVRPR